MLSRPLILASVKILPLFYVRTDQTMWPPSWGCTRPDLFAQRMILVPVCCDSLGISSNGVHGVSLMLSGVALSRAMTAVLFTFLIAILDL